MMNAGEALDGGYTTSGTTSEYLPAEPGTCERGPGNGLMLDIISEPTVCKVIFNLIECSQAWNMLRSCTETYLWGDIATRTTPAERPFVKDLIESDPEIQAHYRLWGYAHN